MEVPALDRAAQQPATHGDGEAAAIQAAGGGCGGGQLVTRGRHGRACPGHPRLPDLPSSKMLGPRPGMMAERPRELAALRDLHVFEVTRLVVDADLWRGDPAGELAQLR